MHAPTNTQRQTHQTMTALAMLLLIIALPSAARAQSAENVAVVINDNSPDSQRIGDHYVRRRGIPAANVIHIRTVTDETITRAFYLGTIESAVATALTQRSLQDRVLYVVLTKGIPIR